MLSGNVDVRVHRRRRGVQPVLGAGHGMFIWLGKDRLSVELRDVDTLRLHA